MKQSTLLKVASESILKNKMRTLLTMLGIVIGVGAVIVMVAIGNGAQLQIKEHEAWDRLDRRYCKIIHRLLAIGQELKGCRDFCLLEGEAQKQRIIRIIFRLP